MVVKKEQDGFGFTLSKEVFVNSVSPGSSAERAGILSGDRIMKVIREREKWGRRRGGKRL